MAAVAIDLPPSADPNASHYAVLGVDEDVDQDDLKVAYRERALVLHPDKGGDDDQFDRLNLAFRVLSNIKNREAYDQELARARTRDELVLGAPEGHSKKQAQAPMRARTAPTPGSKRSKKPMCCALEWKGMGQGAAALKAIKDADAGNEDTAQQLFERYAALPRGREKKRDWLNGIYGPDRRQQLSTYQPGRESRMHSLP
eukprot:NODE_19622_length_835_cov_3.696328.p1 GENE.NODE_19622_length_835_cov_3.696328~~NODE_19622_length_835_cov_3.696328.p1  ORF type:complete len:200 (+),score=41.75 NODE_19622_length_835_cov_3.696328:94-693(+)